MPGPDRRTFLDTAGRLAVGVAALDAGTVLGTSPPPPTVEGALKVLDGDGRMALPAGAARRLGTTRMRIPGHINALQFSPKGTTLVSATSGELRGWDPRTGKVLFRLNYPSDASVDSGRLTSRDTFVLLVRPNHAGGSQELRQYAFGTGKLLGRSPALKVENSQKNAFAPDGSLVAVVHSAALAVHDTTTGAEKWRQTLPAESVGDLQFFPDGSMITLALHGEVRLYAAPAGTLAGTLQTVPTGKKAEKRRAGGRDRAAVTGLAISADGRWLAGSVGEDAEAALVWDVKAGTVKHALEASGTPIGFRPDASELITHHRGVVTAWSMATAKVARTFEVPRGDIQLSPDGKMIAVAAGDSAILIDTQTGRPLAHSADPPGVPSALRFAGPSRLLGRLDDWGGWVEWDLKTGSPALVRPPGVADRVPAGLSADGRVALYRQTDADARYTAVDVGTGKARLETKGADDVNESVPTVAVTPDGTVLVGPGPQGLNITDAKGQRAVARHGEAPGMASATATDGRTAALAFQTNEGRGFVELYDLAGGRYLRRLTTDGYPNLLAFSPDGHRLLVAHDVPGDERFSQKGTASLFDVRTGRLLFRATPSENAREQAVAYSPDGRMVARVEGNGRIVLWDVFAGQARLTLETTESAMVNALAFSPDSRTLAASVHGGPVFLWDLYPTASTALSATDVECAWAVVQTGDAEAAFGFMREMIRAAGVAVAFLREQVAPLAPPDAKRVDGCLADLDHKEFRKREAAERALANLGERAREAVTKALAAGPGPEVRTRLERLLAAEDRPTPDLLRRLRAVEVVEVIGTSEAGKLLAHWGTGAPGATFTTEALAAAKRLTERGG